MTKRRYRLSFPVWLLVLTATYSAAGNCFAQTVSGPTMIVDGVVRDSSGAVIRGAAVHLESGTFRAATKTDDRGRFSFADVPQGSGKVMVTTNGFVEVSKECGEEGKSGDGYRAVHRDIGLEPSRANEQVVVTPARTEARLSD